MALAFDAFANSTAVTGDISWTHTPVGTPKAVIVFVVQNAQSGADQVSGVTYGGVAMTEIAGSPNAKTAVESGVVYGYFLGASIPTGAQTVTVTVTGNASKRAGSVTLTAAADTAVQDTDATINSDSVANPSATLALGGISCFCMEGLFSGNPAVGDITPPTGWTSRLEHSYGQQTAGWYTYDTIGTADVTMGWTQTADDAIGLGVAIKESTGTIHEGAAAISTSVVVAAVAAAIYAASSAIAAAATTAAAAVIDLVGAAAIVAAATVVPVGVVDLAGATQISGAATVAPVGVLDLAGATSISVAATVAAAGSTGATHEGASSISGAGSVAPAGVLNLAGVSEISGSASVAPVAVLNLIGASAITGAATVAAAGTIPGLPQAPEISRAVDIRADGVQRILTETSWVELDFAGDYIVIGDAIVPVDFVLSVATQMDIVADSKDRIEAVVPDLIAVDLG